jgi:hypothetical protein
MDMILTNDTLNQETNEKQLIGNKKQSNLVMFRQSNNNQIVFSINIQNGQTDQSQLNCIKK